MTLLPVNLFEAMEVVPGGRFNADPGMENLVNFLNNVLNQTINEINNQGDTILSINQGAGGVTFSILTGSVQGVSAGAMTGGNHALQMLADGQLVVCWREFTGAGSNYLFRFLKAASPYTYWTSLDGTSVAPTDFAYTDSGAGNAPCFCQDNTYGNLYVFHYQQGTNEWFATCYPNNGDGTFAAATASVVIDTFSTTDRSHAPAAISKGGFLHFASNQNNGATFDLNVYRGTPTATSSSWAQMNNFRGVYDGVTRAAFTTINDQARFVDLGGDGLMLLWEWSDSSSRANVAFTTSADNGATWAFRDTSGGGTYIEYNDPDNGNLLTLSAAGTNVGSDLFPAGSNAQSPICRWDAAYIAGSEGQEVALTYVNGRTSTTNAGVRYAHWDASAGWSATATRPLLYGGRPARANGLVTTGGIVRALFFLWRSFSSVATGSFVACRCAPGEDSEDPLQWSRPKTLINLPMDTALATGTTLIEGFCVSTGGIVTISGKNCIPVIFTRQQGDSSAQSEVCFSLLPVATIDGL